MENTNLNVNPYYDDFSEDKNFHRVLFRPGFAVQARELTQLQTILQNQIERHGRHVFKEGTVVIPGNIGFTVEYYAVKLQSTFVGGDISGYIGNYVGKIITGETTGVKAEVIQVAESTAADPITLFVKYVSTGYDRETSEFADGENIFADGIIGEFGAGVISAKTLAVDSTATGSSANIESGVYFIRGHFVRVEQQRIILDKYTNTPSYRIGLNISESLVTPEDDTSLQDNAQGTSNENAKGAHRLKFTLTLAKKSLNNTDDTDFVELMRLKNGITQYVARPTEYSVLGENIARRTFDLQGDVTIRDFSVDIRESLNDGTNNGVYTQAQTTDDNNTPSDDLLTVQVSPGKAYVRGYEIDVIVPSFLDLEKPRQFRTVDSAITPVEVGNYALIENAYNIPDLSPSITGEVEEPYRTIELFDTRTSSRGSASGTRIGFARARAIEHNSGNDGSSDKFLASSTATDSDFKLYLFDIRMFTQLTLSGTPDPVIATGSRVRGSTSGAIGYATSDTTGTSLFLTSVVGTFSAGETLICTSSTEADELLQDSGSTDLTISSIDTFAFENAKQVFMNDPDAGQDFTADLKLESEFSLNGFASIDAGDLDAVIGSGSAFSSELRVGDIVKVPSGASGVFEERVVDAVTSDTVLDLDSDVSNAITSVNIIRARAKLNDQNKNILLRKLQKNTIKSLKTDENNGISQTTVTVRKEFVETANNSGAITINAGTNETFNAVDNDDYVVSIIVAGTSGGASGAVGDIINVNSSDVTVTGAGSSQLTITSTDIFGTNGDAKVKIVATLTRTVVNEKTKTLNRGHLVLVDNDGIGGGAQWGTSAHHSEISLGVADTFKLHGVFDSGDPAEDPILPEFTGTSFSGTFTKGERIIGGSSNAVAIIVNTTSPITYVLVSANDFTAGETITGQESGATATLSEQTEVGSSVVTNSFTLDTGQRDNYYDISRLVKKPNAVAPTGRLLIVTDFFSHGSGDFFNVDSYSAIDYKEIPTYTATRIDPEVREPSGEFDLRDCVDFRPRVADATQTTSTLQGQTAFKVTDYSLTFESRSFSGTGSSTINIPKDNSNFQYDLEFYLARIDFLFLTSTGLFQLVKGADAENPVPPKRIDDAMLIAEIDLPAYVFSVLDVGFKKETNRKFSMKDIGAINDRVTNLEYYTALSLLEKDAKSLQIQDANGFDRFKSGFVVDNFTGHSVGDVRHPDYRVAIDLERAELRPKYFMKGVPLIEQNAQDPETDPNPLRTNDGYAVTNENLATLPYVDVITAEQVFATRVENLNPVLSFAWAGICKLTPSSDEWFETERLPDLIINREGNFDTVLAENRNAIGTVWNSWQTQWSGRTTTSSRQVGNFRETVTRETGTQNRSGIRTDVVVQIDRESQGDRIVSQALIPFIRSRNVSFKATGMKPLTRVYPFFDKTDVSAYVTATTGVPLAATRVASLAPQTTGSWQSISKIEFDYFKRGGNPLLFTTSSSHSEDASAANFDPDTFFNVRLDGTQFSGDDITAARVQSILDDADFRNAGRANNASDRNQTLLAFGRRSGESVSIQYNYPGATSVTVRLQRWSNIDVNWNISGAASGSGTSTPNSRSHTFPINSDSGTLTLNVNNNSNGLLIQDITFNNSNLTGSMSVRYSAGDTTFEQIGTRDQYPGSTRSTVVKDSLTLLPNENGEIFIRGFATDTDGVIGANDRLYDVKIYDQDGVLIPRSNYEITENLRWSNVIRAIDNSTDTFAEFRHNLYQRQNKQNAVTIKVIDGERTITPSSGTVVITDNTATQSTNNFGDANALVTTAAGTVEGVFNIPNPNIAGNPRFRTGDRLFRLSSSPTNVEEPLPETFAQATYSATGTLNTVQETIIATRNGRVEVTNVSDRRSTSRTISTTRRRNRWRDPLAQSFMPQAEGGEYLTRVDIFFSQKDANIPVTLQIREMQNGYPTPNVLPFSSVTLEPDEVDVSDDASIATTFTFDSPVFVKEGVEYCIVLLTDSQQYLCWISRMGETDITANRLVSEQPYLGVLFKSQNSSTWTAYDFEDLKFVLYRASFDTTVTSNLILVNDELPVKSLQQNPIQTFSGSNIIKVLHPNHQMHATGVSFGNNVTIAGVSSGVSTTLDGAVAIGDSSLSLTSSTGFPSSGTVTLKVTSTDSNGDTQTEVMSGTISGTDVTGLTRAVEGTEVGHADNSAVEYYVLGGIPLTEINKTHASLDFASLDYYTIETVTNADTSGLLGGSNVTATENAMMDQLQTLIPVIEHPGTSIVANLRSTTGTSVGGSQTSFSLTSQAAQETIPINDNFEFLQPRMICSSVNENNELSGEKSFVISLQMTSDSENLSPVVDLESKSVIAVANRIDNVDSSSDVYPTSTYVSPTEPDGDSSETVYITRKAQLQTPATSLKVFFDAMRPPNAEIQVMFKILRSDDASDFEELGFEFFNTDGSPDQNVNASTTVDDFIEYEYSAENLDEFIAFAIKIKMQSTNSAQVPRIKDLRVLGLAT